MFDIVRLYETRQSGGKKISPATVSEAQLIGRGARYCPFKLSDDQAKYQRKYDTDLDDPMRLCEELYYHCQNDSRYIGELHNALREQGIDLDKAIVRHHKLKESFKTESLYKHGYVFINERLTKSWKEVNCLLPSIRDKIYSIFISTGHSGEDVVMDSILADSNIKVYTTNTTFSDIAKINYSIVNRAL